MTPTAQIFFALSLGAALTYCLLGGRALRWNLRGRGNMALALLCAGCATWSLGMGVMLTAEHRETALLWYRIAAVGWFVAPAAALHSYLRLLHADRLGRHEWIEPLLYLPAPVFVLKTWNGFVGPVDVTRTRNGWVESVAYLDGWYAAYFIYLLTYALTTVTISGLAWRAATNRTDRLQCAWLTLGGATLIPLIACFGLIMPVVAPGLPEVSHLLALVWVLAASKAMQIRNPWTLTPQLVADQLLEALSEAVLITDPSGRVQVANPAAERLFGSTSRELRGSHVSLLAPLRDAGLVVEDRVRLDVAGIEVEVRAACERSGDAGADTPSAEGSTKGDDAPPRDLSRWFDIGTSAVLNQLDEPVGVLITLRETTATKAAEHDLTYRANHDLLTGLGNRHLLEHRLDEAAAAEGAHELAVLLVDLDGFKAVNDDHGHAVGDQVLAILGRRILGCLRASDTAARIGGDEFVVLLPEVSDSSHASAVARRLLDACRRPCDVEGKLLRVDASIGVVVADAGSVGHEHLLRLADRAMYRAKERPEDPIVITMAKRDPGAGGDPEARALDGGLEN
ncbi:MAG: diguanylate cyclase [Acidobacteria bacterium]|nr:MAG: diguanylate cyclase [Acidobacteriota bacterium]REJ99394.1 MAG: diguanylate cyclase [Acidobacteriota bacterium]